MKGIIVAIINRHTVYGRNRKSELKKLVCINTAARLLSGQRHLVLLNGQFIGWHVFCVWIFLIDTIVVLGY
jgi:hypothetical protein